MINVEKIKERLSAVAYLKDNPIIRRKLRVILKNIYDMERLNG